MQIPLRAVTIAIALFWSASVLSQDRSRSTANDHELDGVKILVLNVSEASRVEWQRPIWDALEAEGVEVTFVRGKFSKYDLDAFEQLWVFSSSQYDARVLTRRDFQAILQFARSGKGLYLLSDATSEDAMTTVRPPARRIGQGTFEANAIAGDLFNARVHGCYAGQQTLEFTDPTPSHSLRRNVRYLYEGTTVSHISDTKMLDVIVSASDGKPLIAVPKSERLRVVLDCGHTRYHPKSSGDCIEFALNVARFLNGT